MRKSLPVEALEDTVVLELVDDVNERHEGVVDGDYLHIGIRRRGTEHENSNTTEAINAHLCRRGSQTVNMSGVSKTITSPLSPQLTQSAPGREPLRATFCSLRIESVFEMPVQTMGKNAAFTRAKRESNHICDTSVTVAQQFQLTKAIMSDVSVTVRSCRNPQRLLTGGEGDDNTGQRALRHWT